jgi:DNA repair protein RecO (recombination protein O)
MIASTLGIVLHSIKYGETSLIVKIYTSSFGLVSYMVNGARSSKGKNKGSLFQAGNILELEVYNKQGKNLQHIKEQKLYKIYNHIPNMMVKTSICMYMLEVLNQCIKEHEQNETLFDFLIHAFEQLDNQSNDDAIFPSWFMIALASHLGFEAGNSFEENKTIFDMQEGLYVEESYHAHALHLPYSKYWYELSQQEIPQNTITSKKERLMLLESVEKFFQMHIENFKQLQTPRILREVLS